MSLYERLQRDAQLREDLVELLKEFDGDAIDQIEQMQPKAGRPAVGTSGEGGGTLRNVPVRGKTQMQVDHAQVQSNTENVSSTATVLKLTEEQAKNFEDYFGAHPELLEGARFFGNSENQPFIEEVTGTDRDLSRSQPVTTNLPIVNMVVNGYKCRAIMDSGCTSTMLSTGLLEQMPDLKDQIKPTSFAFFGVGENRMKFVGMLYKVTMQLAQNLKCVVTAAVYENQKPMLLVGNDLVGGPNAKLEILGMNASRSFYVLGDNDGHIACVQYLKNVEGAGYPPEPMANQVATSGGSRISQLFR